MRLGWRTPRIDNLKLAELANTRIENAHKVCKKTFVFIYVAVICTITGGTEQIRACVSRYDQPGALCLCRLGIENLLKSQLIYSVSYFNLDALGLCLSGRSPPKHPRGGGTEST